MPTGKYLLDTHALIFWANRMEMPRALIDLLDASLLQGGLMVSSVCFWEIALLVKKKRLELEDIHGWKTELLENTGLQLINPSVSDMIDSTRLTDHHKDPFDRLLISQTLRLQATLITRDPIISLYPVDTLWMVQT
jgi:PIN domain nuclease of toxin-antitoxin system